MKLTVVMHGKPWYKYETSMWELSFFHPRCTKRKRDLAPQDDKPIHRMTREVKKITRWQSSKHPWKKNDLRKFLEDRTKFKKKLCRVCSTKVCSNAISNYILLSDTNETETYRHFASRTKVMKRSSLDSPDIPQDTWTGTENILHNFKPFTNTCLTLTISHIRKRGALTRTQWIDLWSGLPKQLRRLPSGTFMSPREYLTSDASFW